MAKRRMGLRIFLLCFCLFLLPWQALAASTADSKEPISTDKDCSLTISYSCDGISFSGETVTLYKIADISANFQYTPVAPFQDLTLNGIQTTGEWDTIRATAETLIVAHTVQPAQTAVTDDSGKASFEKLKPGLYLASAVSGEKEGLRYRFDSALIALPGLGADGLWQYEVTIAAKPQILPPVEPGNEIQLKVLKLWKGDGARPQSIQVEIFRDGVSYATVELSEENRWFYTWTAEDDGAVWAVVERNVPAGYTMTVQQKENSFILTNTRTPDTPDTPDTPTTPTTPDEPTAPTAPDEPTAPTTPDEPTVPTAPDDPTAPTTPDEPTVPTTPDEPTVPTAPDDPTAPTAPDEPTVPTAPDEPTVPTAPDEPTAPTAPDEPTAPSTPDAPTTPSTPGNPDAPPQTGDTANVLLYIVLMFLSGALLVILGIAGKRSRHEN